MKKKIFSFIISFLISFVIFFGAFFGAISKKSVQADNSYTSGALYSGENFCHLSTCILVCVNDININFFINLNTLKSSLNIFLLNTKSVKYSTEHFNTDNPKASCLRFFGVTPKKIIYISSDFLSDLTNGLGGITINFPHEITSPSNSNTVLSADETNQHIFGEELVKLINRLTTENYEKQLNISEIFLILTTSFFENLSDDMFSYLIENCETDISYADYINNKSILSTHIENRKFSAAEGVWFDDEYLLQ